jgi:hypothetical protein
LGAIYANFGAFRVRIAVAASSMPTSSTRWGILRSSLHSYAPVFLRRRR